MKLFIQRTNRLPEDIDTEVANISEVLYNGSDEVTYFSGEIGEITVTENDEDYRVEIFIPGFRKSDIKVEAAEDGTVFVNAVADEEFPEETASDLAEEFSDNIYTCSFRLPENTDVLSLEAYYENGVLTILAPKMAEEDLD